MNEIIKQTKRWVEKADKDLMAAEKLFEAKIYEYSLFHVQQAIEKYLKAFLTLKNKPFKKTHDLTFLLKECIRVDKSFESLLKLRIDRLYPKSVEIRYPEFTAEVSEREVKEAIEIAKKVKSFVLKKIFLI